jgi:hypothetical protein
MQAKTRAHATKALTTSVAPSITSATTIAIAHAKVERTKACVALAIFAEMPTAKVSSTFMQLLMY